MKILFKVELKSLKHTKHPKQKITQKKGGGGGKHEARQVQALAIMSLPAGGGGVSPVASPSGAVD